MVQFGLIYHWFRRSFNGKFGHRIYQVQIYDHKVVEKNNALVWRSPPKCIDCVSHSRSFFRWRLWSIPYQNSISSFNFKLNKFLVFFKIICLEVVHIFHRFENNINLLSTYSVTDFKTQQHINVCTLEQHVFCRFIWISFQYFTK